MKVLLVAVLLATLSRAEVTRRRLENRPHEGVCPVPDVNSFENKGKTCLNDDCLNGNARYFDFTQAWTDCGNEPTCGFILKFGNKYFLRRPNDPDSGGQGYTYECTDAPTMDPTTTTLDPTSTPTWDPTTTTLDPTANPTSAPFTTTTKDPTMGPTGVPAPITKDPTMGPTGVPNQTGGGSGGGGGSSHGDPIIWTFNDECYDLHKDGLYVATEHPDHDHIVQIAVYNDYMREIQVVGRDGSIWLSINNLGEVLNNHPYYFHQVEKECPPLATLSECVGSFLEFEFDAQDFYYIVETLRHDYNDQALKEGEFGFHLDIYPRPYNNRFAENQDQYNGLYFKNPLPEELEYCPAGSAQ